jgi:hypothetical protein
MPRFAATDIAVGRPEFDFPIAEAKEYEHRHGRGEGVGHPSWMGTGIVARIGPSGSPIAPRFLHGRVWQQTQS